MNKWGRDAIIGDYVRLIRTLRPDVIVTMNIQGRGGDRAHEATTVLAREAYRAAGNPAMYPEQISEGLRAWQPKKLYFAAGFGVIGAGGRGGRGGGAPAAQTPAPSTAGVRGDAGRHAQCLDPFLGRTYAEIGADAHSNHKCQGTSGLPALPGFAGGRGGGVGRRGAPGISSYTLTDSGIRWRIFGMKRRSSTISTSACRGLRSLPERIRPTRSRAASPRLSTRHRKPPARSRTATTRALPRLFNRGRPHRAPNTP